MNCAELEGLICDYVDGTLAPTVRAEVDRHLSGCAACAAMARDSAAAVGFIGRAATVEPPQELITRILFHSPWRKYRSGLFWKPLNTLLQPRFAMSMALTILSLSMVVPKVRPLQPRDLAPAQVWAGLEDRAYRLWARTQKFYDNLKFVYQIQSTLREWQQQIGERPGTEAPPEKAPEPNTAAPKTPAKAAPGEAKRGLP